MTVARDDPARRSARHPLPAAARRWIRRLGLRRHSEGGYYRETYRARGRIPQEALPRRYRGPRAFSTAILFLLPGRDISCLHRLASDEVWHYHAGGSLSIHAITPDGRYRRFRLGPNRGCRLQATVPAGWWFGATVDNPRSFSLVGCTVAPGFEFADFTLADRTRILRRFPRRAALICRLTR